MKEAMWGVGLIIIALITFVVISTVSNVVTTNQQDYEFMKSSVEAAMHDAVDETRYRRGICICTKNDATDGVIAFNSESDYELFDPNDKSECDGVSPKYTDGQCKYRHGEYIINADVFTESLISRFGTVAKTGEKYDITVQDVIPYPPKVSVRITYYQYFNSTISDDQQRPIVNQMDAILEGGKVTVTRSAKTGNVKVAKLDCKNNQVTGNLTIKDIATGTTKTVASGTQVNLQVGSYTLTDGKETVTFTVDPNDVSNVQVVNLGIGNCTCDGTAEVDDTPADTPSNPTPQPGGGGTCTWHNVAVAVTCTSQKEQLTSCATKDYNACGCNKISYETARESCKNGCQICATCAGGAKPKGGKCYKKDTKTVYTKAKGGFAYCSSAVQDCKNQAERACPSGYTASYTCNGYQNWAGKKKDGSSFSFTKTCSGGKSCSNYTPYTSCRCQG